MYNYEFYWKLHCGYEVNKNITCSFDSEVPIETFLELLKDEYVKYIEVRKNKQTLFIVENLKLIYYAHGL